MTDQASEPIDKQADAIMQMRMMRDELHSLRTLLSRVEASGERTAEELRDCSQERAVALAQRDILAAAVHEFSGYGHGEDCPADDYDLEEGETPGECECAISVAKQALKEAGLELKP